MDVADPELGAGVLEVLGQGEAHLADALDGHAQAGEVVAAEAVLHRHADTDEGAIGGRRRRVAIAGAAAQGFAGAGAGHVAAALGHDAHFGDAGAGVGGGDVAAAQAVDEIAHGLEQRLALVAMRVADDHGLAAAQRQVGQGRLVGHAAGQAQHITQRLFVIQVGPHAAAAQGRAEVAVVDGDDGLEAGRLVVAEDHLLVIVELDMGEDGHGIPLILVSDTGNGSIPSPSGRRCPEGADEGGLTPRPLPEGEGLCQAAGSNSCSTWISPAMRRARSCRSCSRTLASARSLTGP
ncbi:hypothetical protein D9M68_688230 [compost metagenome]